MTAQRGADVHFDKVQKSYDGETLVVHELNLKIERGEFLTMLGPSGSGKTTCLMMLAGFEPATAGEIFLNGRPINDVPPHKRGIGMVFQNYALFPHMTVAENLAFPLQVRGIDKATQQQKIKRALEMVELPQFGNRRPAQLSGGQQQRVAVARALVFEPELVLMDEPLGALDKQLREQMQYEIKHIHENLGVTVVYVTHDQTEALTMSDRVAVFNAGIIQQLSTPDELYEAPENSFVAQFIGENNKLTGKVEAMNGTALRRAAARRDAAEGGEGQRRRRRRFDHGLAPARTRRVRPRRAHGQRRHRPHRGDDLSRRPHPRPHERGGQSGIRRQGPQPGPEAGARGGPDDADRLGRQ